MKSVKAAAVLAGSLVIAGAAAPAFAAQNVTEVARESLGNTVSNLNKGPVHVQPLEQSDLLDAKEQGRSLRKTVDRASAALGKGTPLLGGLPVKG
jgi:hypothetical protein